MQPHMNMQASGWKNRFSIWALIESHTININFLFKPIFSIPCLESRSNRDLEPDAVSPGVIFPLSTLFTTETFQSGKNAQTTTNTHARVHTQTHTDPEWHISAH